MTDVRTMDNWGRRPDEARRVVVTGMGPITASGTGVEGLWSGLRAARSPVGRITRFETDGGLTAKAAFDTALSILVEQLEGFEIGLTAALKAA